MTLDEFLMELENRYHGDCVFREIHWRKAMDDDGKTLMYFSVYVQYGTELIRSTMSLSNEVFTSDPEVRLQSEFQAYKNLIETFNPIKHGNNSEIPNEYDMC